MEPLGTYARKRGCSSPFRGTAAQVPSIEGRRSSEPVTEFGRLVDPERVAREAFGMIRRGELLYRLVPPDSGRRR